MIFAPFDAENISLLKNVKISIYLYRSFLIKREIIETSEKTVLIRNIDYTELRYQETASTVVTRDSTCISTIVFPLLELTKWLPQMYQERNWLFVSETISTQPLLW